MNDIKAVVIASDLGDLASEINSEHLAALDCALTAVEHARRAGSLLLQAKAAVDRGQWLTWLSNNIKVSARQAQRYMQLAEANATRVSHSSMRQALAELATPAKTSETVPWAGDDVSWLPIGAAMLRATVDPIPGQSGGTILVQQSTENRGYVYMAMFEDPSSTLYGISKPVLAAGATTVFRHLFGRDPNVIEWESVQTQPAHLESFLDEWLVPDWLLEARQRRDGSVTSAEELSR